MSCQGPTSGKEDKTKVPVSGRKERREEDEESVRASGRKKMREEDEESVRASGRKKMREEDEASVRASGRKKRRVETEDDDEGTEDDDEGTDEDDDEGVLLQDVPRRIIWGRRCHLDGEAWTCEVCNHNNRPSRHLFIDLPAFKCGSCRAKKRVDFRFSFGNLAANGECAIGEILDQGQKNDCVPFALAKSAEITARIWTILSGSGDEIPTVDPETLKDHYWFSLTPDQQAAHKGLYDVVAMRKMMKLLQTAGVQDEMGTYTCRIGGVKRVRRHFEDIVKELANGYPLIVDLIPGSGFKDLLYGEVYRCPFTNKTRPPGLHPIIHTVVLVGAARLGHFDYFYFLNSYGAWWCERYQRKEEEEEEEVTIGGIGKILARDTCYRPYKFLRCKKA